MRLSRMPAATRTACLPASGFALHMSHNSDVIPRIASSVESVPHSRIRELAEIAMSMDGVSGSTSANPTCRPRTTSSRPPSAPWTTATRSTPRTPACPRCGSAIAAHYRRLHGVELDPASEIVVTASGVQALNVGIRCVLDPGDEALVLTPAWPNGASIVGDGERRVRQVPHPLCGGRYAVDFDALEARRHAPHAPAASTPRPPIRSAGWPPRTSSDRLLDFARRHDLWLLADEVYDRLYYAGARLGDPVPSILRKATPRRRGAGGAVLLQELLHDRLARRLAGRAPRPGATRPPS